jgi:hypothetical protein
MLCLHVRGWPQSTDATDRSRLLYALAQAPDTRHITETLQYTLSPEASPPRPRAAGPCMCACVHATTPACGPASACPCTCTRLAWLPDARSDARALCAGLRCTVHVPCLCCSTHACPVLPVLSCPAGQAPGHWLTAVHGEPRAVFVGEGGGGEGAQRGDRPTTNRLGRRKQLFCLQEPIWRTLPLQGLHLISHQPPTAG